MQDMQRHPALPDVQRTRIRHRRDARAAFALLKMPRQRPLSRLQPE
jgi:hypothetical protein